MDAPAPPPNTPEEACWVCDARDRLTLTSIAFERATETQPPALPAPNGPERVLTLATCFSCRSNLHLIRAEERMALRARTTAAILLRALDVTLVLTVMGGGFALATAAGWTSSWGANAAAVLWGLSIPLGALYFLTNTRKERNRQARWQENPWKKKREDALRTLRERFDGVLGRQAGNGWLPVPAMTEERLLTPATWEPRSAA